MAYDLLSAPGVLARHADDCPARDGGRCTCGPIGYRASEEGRPIGPLMETSGEALRWRREQYASLEDAERDELVTAAIADFLDEATTGGVLTPDGRRYTGTERRALRQALTREVIPALGDRPLRELRARHVQELLRDLRDRLPASQVADVEDALRSFLEYALDRGLIDLDPFPPPAASNGHHAPEKAMVPDEAIWLILKVATVVFVLIALILVAESV
jgi:hypothetical protein